MPDEYDDKLYQHILREEYRYVTERELERQMYQDYCDWLNERYNIEYEATQQYLIQFDDDGGRD